MKASDVCIIPVSGPAAGAGLYRRIHQDAQKEAVMVFSSLIFLFGFLLVFLFLYYICPDRWKNLCLFVGSLIFYFYGVKDQPLYFFLLILSIWVNYRIGILLGRRRKKENRKKWLAVGIVFNLFWLFLFKYSGFFAENLNILLTYLGLELLHPVCRLPLPIGISFYTFQAISYLADVYRKDASYEPSFIDYGMYITMFPQLIAGPIVTYNSIRQQLHCRTCNLPNFEEGLRQFTLGLGFKVLLANQVGRLWSQVEAIGFESISTPLAWMGIIAFSLQIYFDFYGYSLMAKGLGQLMGFSLPDNFAHPYLSLSMTEFWRRWHITLGSWFRDYIYIPLGGNRAGSLTMIRNLLIVWLLTGFWHGASWNFLLWGLALFLLIFIEKAGLGRILHRFPLLGHLYMMLVIPLNWLIFAVTDLGQMKIYFLRLFPFMTPHAEFTFFSGDYLKYGQIYLVSLIAGLIFMTGLPEKLYRRYKSSLFTAAPLLAVFRGCVYLMKLGADDPFLYFRF